MTKTLQEKIDAIINDANRKPTLVVEIQHKTNMAIQELRDKLLEMDAQIWDSHQLLESEPVYDSHDMSQMLHKVLSLIGEKK